MMIVLYMTGLLLNAGMTSMHYTAVPSRAFTLDLDLDLKPCSRKTAGA